MPGTIPDAVIEKYIKVKALADAGAAGEKENAKRLVEKFEKEHPGIEFAAHYKTKSEQSQSQDTPANKTASAEQDNWWPKQQNASKAPNQSNNGNWEKIFEFANAFWGTASDFANSVSEAALGRQVAEETHVSSRVTSADNLIVTMKIPVPVFEFALQMTDTQKLAFKKRLHELLDQELDELLECN